jgi:hypothetical protein
MRYRTILGMVVAVCLCAVTAAPALAGPVFKATEVGKEFTETEPGKGRTHSLLEEPENLQNFRFGPFHIQCTLAVGHGKVTAEQSKTFYEEVEFKKCYAIANLAGNPPEEIHLPAYFHKPVDIEWHANRWAEVGSESESELMILNSQTITAGVPSLKCTINWPAQKVPVKAAVEPESESFSMVSYENVEVKKTGKEEKILPKFPSGFQKQVIIKSDLKGMEYSLEGGQCENFETTEGKKGQYHGLLRAFVIGGNLEVGEEEEVV